MDSRLQVRGAVALFLLVKTIQQHRFAAIFRPIFFQNLFTIVIDKT